LRVEEKSTFWTGSVAGKRGIYKKKTAGREKKNGSSEARCVGPIAKNEDSGEKTRSRDPRVRGETKGNKKGKEKLTPSKNIPVNDLQTRRSEAGNSEWGVSCNGLGGYKGT